MSFKKLSAAEAGSAKALRVRVVTAGPGDNVQSLAERMGFGDYKEDRFRVLNAIDANEKIVPGRRYKVIQ
jgi:predicted Zn-dependent protease